MADQVLYIPPRSGEEIVDAANDRPIPEQALAKMGPEKAGTAGDQDAVLEMHGPQPPPERDQLNWRSDTASAE